MQSTTLRGPIADLWAQRLGPLEDSRPWLIAGIGGLVAGLLHFAIAPDHFAEAAGQGLFFAMLGTAQVAWGMWHLARPSLRTWLLGIALAVLSIAVYVAALFVDAPFAAGVEAVDYLALFTKVVEGATAVVLAAFAIKGAPALGRPRGRLVLGVLLATLLGVGGAAASFGLGYGLEAVAPGLSEPSEHHHGEGDAHATSRGFGPGAPMGLLVQEAGFKGPGNRGLFEP